MYECGLVQGGLLLFGDTSAIFVSSVFLSPQLLWMILQLHA